MDHRLPQVEIDREVVRAARADRETANQLEPALVAARDEQGVDRTVVELDEGVRPVAAGVHFEPDGFVFAGGKSLIREQDFAAATVEREQVDLPRREVEDFGLGGADARDLETGELHDHAFGGCDRRIGDAQVEGAGLKTGVLTRTASAAAGGEVCENYDARYRAQDFPDGGGGGTVVHEGSRKKTGGSGERHERTVERVPA